MTWPDMGNRVIDLGEVWDAVTSQKGHFPNGNSKSF